ncbi:DNA-binding TFAR19-related protein [Ostreococcus tauri]|uniref:DNA-binding TFAR19-related protein n=1 Tax=Ostreococcus tauri TaxID=70448 RepID=A0A090MDX7_OSTTA|nr:DNA-binding TFAR19-related protein [Ostreococcus tauri]CEG01126.1 DNA-binding TFAR19-related protein [Ostreococcus tauri]|eukprot:XP_022840804.1 DNA-binding TFAR19-related protein [Ostreococcus tauri]
MELDADGNVRSGEDAAQREAVAREAEERRGTALASVLEPAARERLSRIAIVKPEKARALEESILRAAQSGKVHRVSEQALIGMLESSATGAAGATGGRVGSITFDRRRNAFDEDDED